MDTKDGVTLLPTLTHARIRIAQRDPVGARRVLEEMLAAQPDDAGALSLLDEIRFEIPRPAPAEPVDEPLAAPVAGDAGALRARFREAGPAAASRVVRLSDYLARIRRSKARSR